MGEVKDLIHDEDTAPVEPVGVDQQGERVDHTLSTLEKKGVNSNRGYILQNKQSKLPGHAFIKEGGKI